MSPQSDRSPAHFKTMEQVDVPQGRHGKHNKIVATILRDLDKLKDGTAIKIPLSELAESKEKVRSALNRATRKAGRTVATASDASFLYVWNVTASRK
jgi:DNA helicase TIP49 (TBP-interacting protein)